MKIFSQEILKPLIYEIIKTGEKYLNEVIQKEKTGDVKCNFCDKRFVSDKNMQTHMIKFHKDKIKGEEKCSYCDFRCNGPKMIEEINNIEYSIFQSS